MRDVEALSKRGIRSYHPWFPTDRTELDKYWSSFRPEMEGWNQEGIPRVLDDRIPKPWGKDFTIIFDPSALADPNGGLRPGALALLQYFAKRFEIIIAGIDLFEVFYVDERRTFISHHVASAANPYVPVTWWKSLRVLNRPFENTIIIDTKPENVTLNPNNSVIIKEYNPALPSAQEDDLAMVMLFVDALHKQTKQGHPVYAFCPKYHDVHKSFAEKFHEETKRAADTFNEVDRKFMSARSAGGGLRDLLEARSNFQLKKLRKKKEAQESQ